MDRGQGESSPGSGSSPSAAAFSRPTTTPGAFRSIGPRFGPPPHQSEQHLRGARPVMGYAARAAATRSPSPPRATPPTTMGRGREAMGMEAAHYRSQTPQTDLPHGVHSFAQSARRLSTPPSHKAAARAPASVSHTTASTPRPRSTGLVDTAAEAREGGRRLQAVSPLHSVAPSAHIPTSTAARRSPSPAATYRKPWGSPVLRRPASPQSGSYTSRTALARKASPGLSTAATGTRRAATPGRPATTQTSNINQSVGHGERGQATLAPQHRRAGSGDPRLQDPDLWLAKFERSSATYLQNLESLLSGNYTVSAEAMAPPLQLPLQGDVHGFVSALQTSAALPVATTGALGARVPTPGAAAQVQSTATSAGRGLVPAASLPGQQRPSMNQSYPEADPAHNVSTASQQSSHAIQSGMAAAPTAGLSPVTLPPGALGELWGVLKASNQNAARLLSDLQVARKEAQSANERAEESDSLARSFQQQLLARQQQVATWQAALMEMEESEARTRAQLHEALEKCSALTQRAEQAERVAGAVQLRLERVLAGGGLQAGTPGQAGTPATAEDSGGRATVAQLQLQLSQLRADVAAAETRAARAELELASARNRAALAQQELEGAQDRARRSAASASAAREELGNTRSAFELLGRDHERLQRQFAEMNAKLHQQEDQLQRSAAALLHTSLSLQAALQRPAVLDAAAAAGRAPAAANAAPSAGNAFVSGHNVLAQAEVGPRSAESRMQTEPGPQSNGAALTTAAAKAVDVNGAASKAERNSLNTWSTASVSSSHATASTSGGGDAAAIRRAFSQRRGSLMLVAAAEVLQDPAALDRYGPRLPGFGARTATEPGFGAETSRRLGAMETAVTGATGPSGPAALPGSETKRPRVQSTSGTPERLAKSASRVTERKQGAVSQQYLAVGSGRHLSKASESPRRPPRADSPPVSRIDRVAGGTHSRAVGAISASGSLPDATLVPEELLPLSRTPSSAARRRLSFAATSLSSSGRGVGLHAAGRDSGGTGARSPAATALQEEEDEQEKERRADFGHAATAGSVLHQTQPLGAPSCASRTSAAATQSYTGGTPSLADLRKQMAASGSGAGSGTSAPASTAGHASDTPNPHRCSPVSLRNGESLSLTGLMLGAHNRPVRSATGIGRFGRPVEEEPLLGGSLHEDLPPPEPSTSPSGSPPAMLSASRRSLAPDAAVLEPPFPPSRQPGTHGIPVLTAAAAPILQRAAGAAGVEPTSRHLPVAASSLQGNAPHLRLEVDPWVAPGDDLAELEAVRRLTLTPRSRMKSPAELDSYRVSASLTASMATASHDSLASIGPSAQHRRHMEAQRLQSVAEAPGAGLVGYGSEMAGRGGEPLSSSAGSGPVDALPGSRAHASQPGGCMQRSPARQPWWSVLLRRRGRGRRRNVDPGSHDADIQGSPNRAVCDALASGHPLATHAHGPASNRSLTSPCVGLVAAPGTTAADTERAAPPPHGHGRGRGFMRAAALHLVVWSGGMASGVLLVMGVAALMEGAAGPQRDPIPDGGGREALGLGGRSGCGQCRTGEEGTQGRRGARELQDAAHGGPAVSRM